jgi:pimeloyl-ACP methyl ester carboxylesterase
MNPIIMNKTVSSIILLYAVVSLCAQEITGSWEGSLEVQNTKLRLVFHIERSDSILTTKMDSPDQGAFGLPTTRTNFRENKLEIVASGLGLYYNGSLENDTIRGTFNQGGIPFPLLLMRTEEPQFNRPQTPVGPLPYISEEVTIIPDKKESLSLAGTLTLPDRTAVFPAVVLISGSGPNDRDETLFGHKPLLVLSDYLTRNGFAILRYDKRGVGGSTGDYSKSTIQHFAEDALAAVEYLKQRKEIDREHIGLLGHSEGSIIASMVAAGDNGIDFIVMMAGPGTKGLEVVMDQNDNSMRYQGMEPETIEKIQKSNRELFESLLEWDGSENDRTMLRDKLTYLWEQLPLLIKLKVEKEPYLRNQYNAMITPGYRSFLALDPTIFIEKVTCPVYAINGENDTQVPADKNLTAIKNALKRGGNYRGETKSYPGLNHIFQESITGQMNEYAISEQTISPEVLSDILNWMKKQVE